METVQTSVNIITSLYPCFRDEEHERKKPIQLCFFLVCVSCTFLPSVLKSFHVKTFFFRFSSKNTLKHFR